MSGRGSPNRASTSQRCQTNLELRAEFCESEAVSPSDMQPVQSPKETIQCEIEPHRKAELPSVLVVDDDADNLLFARYALESLSFRVTAIASGIQTVEAALACLPDVILLDLRLNDISGFEVFSRLRARKQLDAVPIIAVTALAQPSQRKEALSVGFSDYLLKPYMIGDLDRMIKRHLSSL